MYSTKSVQALHNLFKGYHQPLPLSKQQSEKLLSGIKSSFREQLNREYGPSSDDASSQAKPAEARRHERDPAATQHLKSILANPLFSYTNTAAPTVRKLKTIPERDPIDVFDHAVAKGMMTIRAAAGCLVAKSQQLSKQPHTAVASSGTAKRILQWLRTSGQEDHLDFLDHKHTLFVQTLTPFLVAEGLEAVIWEWLTRTMRDDSLALSDEERATRASFLLSRLVRAQCQPHNGSLNNAITTILRAEQEFKEHPSLPKLLALSWRSVSWMTTVEAFSRTTPSQDLYEAHMATAERLSLRVPVETAHLHLYHPTHPDHSAALSLFNDSSTIDRLLGKFYKLGPANERSKMPLNVMAWLALLGQDTIEHLRQAGKAQDAENIQELLEARLSSVFNPSTLPHLLKI
ncbi:hypothetical protein HJFPF1_00968 [Paramyrothecium foliicola]|nr:hypothetical protein HJFPF1_00968 [Paramyrothecium foliicola]